jgi:hypothetical protein
VIASFFRDAGDNRMLVYGAGIIVPILSLIFGLFLANKKKEEK